MTTICFVYMFVEDKSKAFAEVLRVLRPGGIFLFTTWDILESNEVSHVFRKIVKNYMIESLPASYSFPFSFNDHVAIKKLLQATGFTSITIESVEKMSIANSAKEAATGLARGGSLYNEIMSRNPAWIEEISETLEKQLAEKYGDSPMAAPMRAVVCEAFAPKS